MKRPTLWPTWLDDIWAKSPAKDQAKGESLAEHTWLVLSRMADLRLLRPNLEHEIGVPNLWARMFWTCLLHDLGKCAQGFQDKLRGLKGTPQATAWGAHRHETFSLAFVDWIFPPHDPALIEDRLWIVSGIASHHRDANYLAITYDPIDDGNVTAVLDSIPLETVRGIHRWLQSCADTWALALNLPTNGWCVGLEEDVAIADFANSGTHRIRAALDEYGTWVDTLQSRRTPTPAELLLRGLVTQADHTASAHVGRIHALDCKVDELKLHWEAAAEARGKHFTPYDHQVNSQITGNALLISPTGSGKTEAALWWASTQTDTPRLFYTLPFQASMNAMYKRLGETFADQEIGLAHGRALLALYRLIAEEEPDYATAERQARHRKNLAGLHHPPIQIFSPYQMLKAAYRLKGYEGLVADFHGAAFIFDEIHAYEANRLALIVEMMRYLQTHHAAKFFVMSATFPSLIRQKLDEALNHPRAIEAESALYEAFCRHELRLLSGDMFSLDNWQRICEDIEAKKTVLICCNTVRRAQLARSQVESQFPDAKVVLLHGRLNGRDRLSREKIVRDATGSNSTVRERIVLVATQVVEVSLDIDLDTLYTDPAPLEALVQRFGRINRRRLQSVPALVHVFTLPNDGQHIYDVKLVQSTLRILEREKEKPVAEDKIGGWLDEIYQGEARDKWLRDYEDSARLFRDVLLRGLRPFQSDSNIEESFYAAFDGIDVLPLRFEQEYLRLMETEPLRAQELMVSIRSYQYGAIKAKGKLHSKLGDYPVIVDVPYDDDAGLDTHAI